MGEVEEVGCVTDGLKFLTLSPDSEVITLVTGRVQWKLKYVSPNGAYMAPAGPGLS